MATNGPKDRGPPSPPAPADTFMPVGTWIRLELPGPEPIVGFTYVERLGCPGLSTLAQRVMTFTRVGVFAMVPDSDSSLGD